MNPIQNGIAAKIEQLRGSADAGDYCNIFFLVEIWFVWKKLNCKWHPWLTAERDNVSFYAPLLSDSSDATPNSESTNSDLGVGWGFIYQKQSYKAQLSHTLVRLDSLDSTLW